MHRQLGDTVMLRSNSGAPSKSRIMRLTSMQWNTNKRSAPRRKRTTQSMTLDYKCLHWKITNTQPGATVLLHIRNNRENRDTAAGGFVPANHVSVVFVGWHKPTQPGPLGDNACRDGICVAHRSSRAAVPIAKKVFEKGQPPVHSYSKIAYIRPLRPKTREF